jgi:toxin ParE1/3/4
MDFKLIWSIREIFIFQYRIIYEILISEIHILTVVHGKRIIEDLI